MLATLLTVFQKPRYALMAVLIAVSVFVFAVWLPNVSLIISVLGSDVATTGEKASFLVSLLDSITTNFTVLSAVVTTGISVLFGMDLALLAYYISMARVTEGVRSISSVSIAGLISGFFGIGCAACGTFILSSVLALAGASSVLAYAPFGGEEFGLVGVGLLLYAGSKLTRKISQHQNVCWVR